MKTLAATLPLEEQLPIFHNMARATGDSLEELREHLVLSAMREAVLYAYRVSRGVLFGPQLVSVAYEGMTKAARAFNPAIALDKRKTFFAYAKFYVRHSTSDALREARGAFRGRMEYPVEWASWAGEEDGATTPPELIATGAMEKLEQADHAAEILGLAKKILSPDAFKIFVARYRDGLTLIETARAVPSATGRIRSDTFIDRVAKKSLARLRVALAARKTL